MMLCRCGGRTRTLQVLDAFDVGPYEAVLTFSPTPGDFGPDTQVGQQRLPGVGPWRSWAPVQQLLNEGILEKNEGWSGLMADHVQEPHKV